MTKLILLGLLASTFGLSAEYHSALFGVDGGKWIYSGGSKGIQGHYSDKDVTEECQKAKLQNKYCFRRLTKLFWTEPTHSLDGWDMVEAGAWGWGRTKLTDRRSHTFTDKELFQMRNPDTSFAKASFDLYGKPLNFCVNAIGFASNDEAAPYIELYTQGIFYSLNEWFKALTHVRPSFSRQFPNYEWEIGYIRTKDCVRTFEDGIYVELTKDTIRECPGALACADIKTVFVPLVLNGHTAMTRKVLLHETGHLFGISHAPKDVAPGESIMCARAGACGSNRVTANDAAAIGLTYDHWLNLP